MTVHQFPDRIIAFEGQDYLYFGGTSYLGMATQPQFQEQLYNSIQQWGTAYGSSRHSNIQLSVYEEAETYFAQNIGAEAVLTVSSGTLAGKLVQDFLKAKGHLFFHYPKTHPALLTPDSSPLFVEGKLNPQLADDNSASVVITLDAILSLEVEPVSLDFLDQISALKKVTLLIDESHSLGILGADGNGLFKDFNHPKIFEKLMISSLTKAYGCSGGIIAGGNKVIQAIKEAPLFVSAAGMNPIFLQSLIKSSSLIKSQFGKLKENLDFFFEEWPVTPIFQYHKDYPVMYCYSNSIYDYLKTEGIIITNFKYPNYEGLMNRIVITANHQKDDLRKLSDTLLQFQKETLQ